MSTCMIYNYCVHRSTVNARFCLVVLFCCHTSNDHTDVLFERINDDNEVANLATTTWRQLLLCTVYNTDCTCIYGLAWFDLANWWLDAAAEDIPLHSDIHVKCQHRPSVNVEHVQHCGHLQQYKQYTDARCSSENDGTTKHRIKHITRPIKRIKLVSVNVARDLIIRRKLI